MKTITGAIDNELNESVVSPFHLLHIQNHKGNFTHDQSAAINNLYFSENQYVIRNSERYLENAINVKNISIGNENEYYADIEVILNTKNILAFFLNNNVSDLTAFLYFGYSLGVNYTNFIKILDGYIDSLSIDENVAVLQIEPKKQELEFFPSDYVNAANGFVLMSSDGDVVEIGGKKFELESE